MVEKAWNAEVERRLTEGVEQHVAAHTRATLRALSQLGCEIVLPVGTRDDYSTSLLMHVARADECAASIAEPGVSSSKRPATALRARKVLLSGSSLSLLATRRL